MQIKDLKELKGLTIQVGSVFKMRMYPEDEITPKDGQSYRMKMFVILGIDNESVSVASVIINSDINDSFFNKKAPFQHEIRQEDYDFLTKERSYVDAYKIRKFAIQRIKDNAEFKGELKEEDIKHIIDKAIKSPTIEPIIKKKYDIG